MIFHKHKNSLRLRLCDPTDVGEELLLCRLKVGGGLEQSELEHDLEPKEKDAECRADGPWVAPAASWPELSVSSSNAAKSTGGGI